MNQVVTISFSEAFKALKNGKHITRKKWKNGFLEYKRFDQSDPLMIYFNRPKTYEHLFPVKGSKPIYVIVPEKPWIPNQRDMLADDWVLVK